MDFVSERYDTYKVAAGLLEKYRSLQVSGYHPQTFSSRRIGCEISSHQLSISWPLEKGDKLRLYHQVRYLSNDFEICLIALHDVPVRDEAISKLKPYCKEIHLLPISRIDAIFNLFRGRLNGLPAQVKAIFINLVINPGR